MASTQATLKLAAALAAAFLGAAWADEKPQNNDQARDREAKRQAEERMRGSELPLHREYRPPTYSYRELHQRFSEAGRLEREGKTREAVKAYVSAARAGSGEAARRLGEIYDTGIPGVARDPEQSLKWYDFARLLGEDVRKPRSGQ